MKEEGHTAMMTLEKEMSVWRGEGAVKLGRRGQIQQRIGMEEGHARRRRQGEVTKVGRERFSRETGKGTGEFMVWGGKR